MMFEDVNQDVYRVRNPNGEPGPLLSVHGYMISATPEQEARIRALTTEQRMDLLIRLSMIRPETP